MSNKHVFNGFTVVFHDDAMSAFRAREICQGALLRLLRFDPETIRNDPEAVEIGVELLQQISRDLIKEVVRDAE